MCHYFWKYGNWFFIFLIVSNVKRHTKLCLALLNILIADVDSRKLDALIVNHFNALVASNSARFVVQGQLSFSFVFLGKLLPYFKFQPRGRGEIMNVNWWSCSTRIRSPSCRSRTKNSTMAGNGVRSGNGWLLKLNTAAEINWSRRVFLKLVNYLWLWNDRLLWPWQVWCCCSYQNLHVLHVLTFVRVSFCQFLLLFCLHLIQAMQFNHALLMREILIDLSICAQHSPLALFLCSSIDIVFCLLIWAFSVFLLVVMPSSLDRNKVSAS